MIADILEPAFELRVKVVVLRVRDQSTSGTITAVSRTPVRYEKKYAIRVAVDDAVDRLGVLLADWVEHLFRRGVHLAAPGNYLAANWAVRIFAVDQVKKIWSNGQRQLFTGKETTRPFVGR